MMTVSQLAEKQYKEICKRTKPYFGLEKINKRYGNPAAVQQDHLLTYRFSDGSLYAEFKFKDLNYGYPNQNIHWKLDEDQESSSNFYNPSVLERIEQVFNPQQKSLFMDFRTSALLLSVSEIIADNKYLPCLVVRFDFEYFERLIFLAAPRNFQFAWYEHLPLQLNPDQYKYTQNNIGLNPKYLKLALSHGYKFTRIEILKQSTFAFVDFSPIRIYGSDTTNFDNPDYRAVIMNMHVHME